MTAPVIEKLSLIDKILAETIWEIFHPNMQRIEKRTPLKQGLTKHEFDIMIADESFLKYVLKDEQVPVGLAIVATDVNKVEWLSQEYFKTVYGDQPVYYMVGLAVSQSYSLKSIMGGRSLFQRVLNDLPPAAAFIYDFSSSIHAALSSFGQIVTGDETIVTRLDTIEYWEIKQSRKIGAQFDTNIKAVSL